MADKPQKPLKKHAKAKHRGYTLADKIEALKMIEVNGSVNKVSKLTGISRATLTKWAEDPRINCELKVDNRKIEELVNKKFEKGEVDLLSEVYRVRLAALRKMETLINTTTRLKDVTDAFAVLSGVGAGGDIDSDPNKGQSIINNIKQSIQQRIYMVQQKSETNGKGNIEITGHTEEQEATEV